MAKKTAKNAPALRATPDKPDFTYREKYDAILRFDSKNILSLVLDTEAKSVSILLTDNDGEKRYTGLVNLTEQEGQ